MPALYQEQRSLPRGVLNKLIGPEGDLRNPNRGLYLAQPVAIPTHTEYPPRILKPPTGFVHMAIVEIPVAPIDPIDPNANENLDALLQNGLTGQRPYLTYLFGDNKRLYTKDIHKPTREGQLYFREGLDITYILPDGTTGKTGKGLLDIYVVFFPSLSLADQHFAWRRKDMLHLNGNIPRKIRSLLWGDSNFGYVNLKHVVGRNGRLSLATTQIQIPAD